MTAAMLTRPPVRRGGVAATARTLGGLALGDFRDRVRRPAYAVILAAAVGLGYVATPDVDTRWVIMNLGSYRGIYNSAYIGMATALAGALWLTLGGFYVVRNAIARDDASGVGELLAATPLRTWAYLAGKFLSNVLVLSSMLGVLAVTALVVQVARGESTTVEPVALVTPFVLIGFPMAVLTAAAALLFEAIPPLRAGLGNVVWFVVWMVIALGGQSPHAPLGGIGVHPVVASMRDEMAAAGIELSGQEFSLGLTYLDRPLKTFEWSGYDPDAGFVLGRLALIVLAAAVALLPALWFRRFDPARDSARAAHPSTPSGAPEPTVPAGPTVPAEQAVPAGPVATLRPVAASQPEGIERAPAALPRTRARPGGSTGRLLAGELRILLQGVSRWWWLGALAISLAAAVAPAGTATGHVLAAAWVWPVLIWSRLGTQRHEYGVEALTAAYPGPRRRIVAEWLAGVLVTAAAGAVPLLRMLIAADRAGVGAWSAAVLFIPALALALGTLSRTHRLFQIIYLVLWYAAVNGVPVADYLGLVRDGDRLAGPPSTAVAGLALILLGSVFLTETVRRRLGG